MNITVIIILIVVGLAVLLAAYVFIKTNRRAFGEEQIKFIKRNWGLILSEAKVNPNTAILDADKLLSYALKAKGIKGNVGEQLKAAPSLFGNLNDVWKAHKVRNQIAHEIGHKVELREVKIILSIYNRALNDLGAKI